ncbi:D-tyrosyl-tRNA(Tyr) deacylase [Litorivicinus lipolyticus]|uniref:D-aminoacyl-tRNA deacylase n=1 Tax=Litorivicinus lipolyticus TaxID=418701 RepID=A0A5Q2QDJ7_9GAMM|nr:D-aminoacyl-tRNA deacylase [Litorivicinus lipolyticus]QGG81214.1 D-tyrosyl-tRNA(Tyr) deacylase [Litorivicinus lipolyticus]
MKALVQCVESARVRVAATVVGEIGLGALVYLGVERGDSDATADALAAKLAKLRVFSDDQGKTNLALATVGGAALVVSQFTLAARLDKGNRPSFDQAAAPELAERLYLRFAQQLRDSGLAVETGRFRADMKVESINDGPATYWLTS